MNFRETLARNGTYKTLKEFEHFPVARTELKSYEQDGKRYYRVPNPDGVSNNVYKSVTTRIDERTDKRWLDDWKIRVGEEEAKQITDQASRRGKAIHDMAEKLLKNEDYRNGHGQINIADFNKIIPILQTNVTHIYGQELPLYSHKLKTAGTTDLACWWNNYPAIVDFKTARKTKLEDQIEAYFIQTACYAKMFQERYHTYMDKIVVILMVDNEEPTVYEDYVYPKWNKKVIEYFT